MKIQRIIPVFLALALLGACKSTTTIVENDVGIIQGSVTLYNIEGDSISSGGATISIEGTSFQTTSNTNGNWQLNNIPAGIYNIIITKSGYDTSLTPEYQFSGAGTQFLEHNVLSQIPFDSLPVLSVAFSKRDLDTSGVSGDSIYILHAMLSISGPDSNTLRLFNWSILDSRIVGDANLINFYPGTLALINSRPISISDSLPELYNTWRSGDTLYIFTRAMGGSSVLEAIGGTNYPEVGSPYILRKEVIIP